MSAVAVTWRSGPAQEFVDQGPTRRAAMPMLTSGTTLMVMGIPILEDTTGNETAVLSSNPEDLRLIRL